MDRSRNALARDRILGVLAGGRILRSAELCAAARCFRPQIARMAHELCHIEGGWYCLPETMEALGGRWRDLEVALRYPGGVLCLAGAARHWGLGEGVIPGSLRGTVLLPIGASHDGTSHGVMRSYNRRLFEVGVTAEELAPGVVFRVTSPERTVCDMFASLGSRGMTEEIVFGVLGDFVGMHDAVEAKHRLMMIDQALGRSSPRLEAAAETVRRFAPHVPR